MAREWTLSTLRDDAYKWADLENFTDRYPASEVTRYINQGIAELWDLLVAAHGYSYYGKTWWKIGARSHVGASPKDIQPTEIYGSVVGSPAINVGTTVNPSLKIRITTGGSPGTAVYEWSIDGGTTYATGRTIPSTLYDNVLDLGVAFFFPSGTYSTDQVTTWVISKETTVADQSSYKLPHDFYKSHMLWLGDDSVYCVDRASPSLNPVHLQSSGIPHQVAYRHKYFDLMPPPDSAYTINLQYVPRAQVLINTTNDNDYFDGINGYEEYAVGYAARRMAVKEGDIEVVNLIQQDMNKLAARIKQMAADRDQGTPKRVQDIRGALSWRSDRRRFLPRA